MIWRLEDPTPLQSDLEAKGFNAPLQTIDISTLGHSTTNTQKYLYNISPVLSKSDCSHLFKVWQTSHYFYGKDGVGKEVVGMELELAFVFVVKNIMLYGSCEPTTLPHVEHWNLVALGPLYSYYFFSFFLVLFKFLFFNVYKKCLIGTPAIIPTSRIF